MFGGSVILGGREIIRADTDEKFEGSKVIKKAIAPHTGNVSIQARTTSRTTPQRTAESLFAEPAPMIAVLIVWVVLRGMPNADAICMVTAAPVSAAKPW